jgi:tRNA pseudouridine55 synthase
MGSFDVVRHFKRHLPPGYGRIGHFGTLDPFACGVLMVGIGGAARLNELVHEYLPKTYLAIGKLGWETETGDWEGQSVQIDSSPYLRQVIASFDKNFILERLQKKFVGEYWQTPPVYSATKFQGKALHAWAREGVEIKKEPVKRHVYNLEVVKWDFPYLVIRVTVSSGTYVRTLFKEAANELGTIGSLIALQRESVGQIKAVDSLRGLKWPQKGQSYSVTEFGLKPEDVLLFTRWTIPREREKAFLNGLPMRLGAPGRYVWGMSQSGENWGLLKQSGEEWKIVINFRASREAPDDP